ncbi:MAG: ATP-binding protein [Pseudomonadota bacterium]
MPEGPTREALEQRITLLEDESAQQKRFEKINNALFKISSAVNMTSSLDELFQSIHLALSAIIDTTNFYIALYDGTKDSITFPYCIDTVDGCYPPVIDVSRTASLTAEVIRTGHPVLVTRAERITQLAESSLIIPACTPSEIWLGVPLKTRNEIIGVMVVQNYHDPMSYDQTDMDVMVSVADQVAIAVERKQAEAEKAELEAQNRQLQKAESLGRMAGAIAHHFNNQLQVVMGNLEMALNVLPQDMAAVQYLNEAMNAACRSAEVSSRMLTYLGQATGKKESLDLSEVCRQSVILLQAAAPKDMILKTDFPSCGPIIRANSGQLEQILAQLVTNAWEAAGKNQGTIGLTVKTVSRANIPASKRFPIDWQPLESTYACLEVADEGHGIPDRDIEKLFDPFFTTKFTGRGLGLPVVMGIVKAHGGGVTVDSEPGRGSTFRVYLPVSTEEIPLQQEKTLPTPKFEESGTVLLIEDEEQVRKMAGIMLTRLGYTVLEAKDGIEAVEIFKQHPDEIRCVLSDLTMPRMDGWKTLAALRKLSPGIPVILSSGYDEARVMAGDHPERPNAFLGKPYQLKELRDTINRVLS